MTGADTLYRENLELGKAEYLLQRLHLHARPRVLGLVLSNKCNLGCVHCYQAKNGDALLAPAAIGRELRRELAGFYPYISTLNLLGGEAFLSPGFSELIDDVTASASRPILRLTTNGMLLDDAWAERIVRAPFNGVTVSIDGASPSTYRKLRRGGELAAVLEGIRRIQTWKVKLGSEFPQLDSFFVVMRSNFREIPQYFRLMQEEGIPEIALETVRITAQNLARTPSLVEDEVISARDEVIELHGLLRQTVISARKTFRAIRFSGLTTLFAEHGLDASFLSEQADGLYPESGDLSANAGFELCPNPWTTMFVTESGSVHLCFLAEPIGNLYQASLAEIWNSAEALAMRSRMISGRYRAAACSVPSCSWREGKTPTPPAMDETKLLLAEMQEVVSRAGQAAPLDNPELPELSAARRLLQSSQRSSLETQALFQQLCEVNGKVHERGQAHIDSLESQLTKLRQECDQLRRREQSWLVRKAIGASQVLAALTSPRKRG